MYILLFSNFEFFSSLVVHTDDLCLCFFLLVQVNDDNINNTNSNFTTTKDNCASHAWAGTIAIEMDEGVFGDAVVVVEVVSDNDDINNSTGRSPRTEQGKEKPEGGRIKKKN